MPWRSLVALLFLAALGCQPRIPEDRFACETDEDCPPAFHCDLRVNRCDAPDGG